MTNQAKKKKPWLKIILLGLLVIVVILAGFYWYYATEKFSDTKDSKADYTMNALDFMQEFKKDIKTANEKYTDKIVVLNGRVSQVEAADTTLNIKIIDPANPSYVIFAFQQQHLAEAKTVKVGDSISIKGSCSGAIYSVILDSTSISFIRSTLNR